MYIAKMTKSMTAQLQPHTVHNFDPISIIGSLRISSSSMTERVYTAAVWLFYFFLNKSACAVLNVFLSAIWTDIKYRRSDSGKTKCFTAYPQVARFLLKKYATDEVRAEK